MAWSADGHRLAFQVEGQGISAGQRRPSPPGMPSPSGSDPHTHRTVLRVRLSPPGDPDSLDSELGRYEGTGA
ncbi:hypothetical protein FF36_01445 [Frankia torreyi]|uniref:Uncharacterized protein n=1 Tax=Frankia torreyi TaxID=1856 RepID=A0A0D8BK29_9ACTN|nr:hypothetical protein FF36_01445 [Frankia torreyi]KQM06755.1 hypothetical protein FF86_10067 [Frankia sp. CpI1-P]